MSATLDDANNRPGGRRFALDRATGVAGRVIALENAGDRECRLLFGDQEFGLLRIRGDDRIRERLWFVGKFPYAANGPRLRFERDRPPIDIRRSEASCDRRQNLAIGSIEASACIFRGID
ncbi:MAG: hypothetical protein ING19_11625 [Azospirillum sp.]|nr:hypothetical protein [Azospirillum sp.]